MRASPVNFKISRAPEATSINNVDNPTISSIKNVSSNTNIVTVNTTDAQMKITVSPVNVNESKSNNLNILNSSQRGISDSLMTQELKKPMSQDQAIVLDSIENVPTASYCYALAEVMDPSKITHVSRISQARVCIYHMHISSSTN